MLILLLLSAIPLVFTLLNAVSIRVIKRKDAQEITSGVSILIPMRNEENNAHGVISAILKSKFLKNSEILVLDDQSSDQTSEILQQYPGIKTLTGTELPAGWLGKNFACHQLVAHSSGDYLVFLDADVRLSPLAISAAITTMERLEWQFISPYPRQIAQSFFERLIQPLLQWSWLSSVPLRFAERATFASMVIANGQFLIVKRAAYLAVDGHKTIRHEVLDDLELARLLVKSGYRGGVAEGSAIADCRMYENRTDLFNGYSKSLWRAFGSPFGALASALFLFATGVLPLLLALSGFRRAWIAYFLLVLSRYVAAARTRSTPSSALLHPFAVLTLIYLIVRSWYLKSRGQLLWRGRSVV
jgi:cellulose synthase/poly-beta-1,6-N-acetylglucosamine synthase-like glycosyltransferase